MTLGCQQFCPGLWGDIRHVFQPVGSLPALYQVQGVPLLETPARVLNPGPSTLGFRSIRIGLLLSVPQRGMWNPAGFAELVYILCHTGTVVKLLARLQPRASNAKLCETTAAMRISMRDSTKPHARSGFRTVSATPTTKPIP